VNGSIAQAITLTNFGNAYTSGIRDFKLEKHSAFQFCDLVEFFVGKKTLFSGNAWDTLYASSPAAWFEKLAAEGCRGYRLHYYPQNDGGVPDRALVAFAGQGGLWSIETLMPKDSLFWLAKWHLPAPKTRRQKIWRVQYNCAKKTETKVLETNLQVSHDVLLKALSDIASFAERNRLTDFSENFAQAMETLRASNPSRYGYHTDLFPDHFLDPVAANMLDACQAASVFGGMGSWNDLQFAAKGKASEYERVSEALFSALNLAVISATNASYKGA